MVRRHNDYTTIKLPQALLDKIDVYIDSNKEYTSRTDLIKEALRRYFNP
jgi:metal-responsive CopG/Arc/MetJ family transcriptional regulator